MEEERTGPVGGRDSVEQREPPSGQGLRVTSLRSVGGHLLRREEVVRAVFEPRMQGPTMSIEEFADRELADARRRQEQARVEGDQEGAVRRQRHLLEAGLEDDEDLFDQATTNEREWDEWRESHPRGSGNRLGKRF